MVEPWSTQRTSSISLLRVSTSQLCFRSNQFSCCPHLTHPDYHLRRDLAKFQATQIKINSLTYFCTSLLSWATLLLHFWTTTFVSPTEEVLRITSRPASFIPFVSLNLDSLTCSSFKTLRLYWLKPANSLTLFCCFSMHQVCSWHFA